MLVPEVIGCKNTVLSYHYIQLKKTKPNYVIKFVYDWQMAVKGSELLFMSVNGCIQACETMNDCIRACACMAVYGCGGWYMGLKYYVCGCLYMGVDVCIWVWMSVYGCGYLYMGAQGSILDLIVVDN